MLSTFSGCNKAITCRKLLKEVGWMKKQTASEEKDQMLAIADESHDMTDVTYKAYEKAKAATEMSLKSGKARRVCVRSRLCAL